MGLPGDAGGLAANVNRWRRQVGAELLPDEETLKTLRPIKLDGNAAHALDLTGPNVAGKTTQRILAAIVMRDGQTWFFKLSGPASLVGEQKAAWEAFLKSVRFGK
jgi:hypothetical protein